MDNPNTWVTFINPNTDQKISLFVEIYPAWRDAKFLSAMGLQTDVYAWAVSLPQGVTYPDGTSRIRVDHQIVWSQLQTAGNLATLKKPRLVPGVRPRQVMYFDEVGG